MPTNIAYIVCLILTGITIAICTGFTISGDLPILLAVGVGIAVVVACICSKP